MCDFEKSLTSAAAAALPWAEVCTLFVIDRLIALYQTSLKCFAQKMNICSSGEGMLLALDPFSPQAPGREASAYPLLIIWPVSQPCETASRPPVHPRIPGRSFIEAIFIVGSN
jgi:hypothetical protein